MCLLHLNLFDLLKWYCFSWISQSVFVFLPGRQSLRYYLCLNKIDLTEQDESSQKRNWSHLILMIVSFAIHIFVKIKIKILSAKQQRSLDVLTKADKTKFVDISSMEKRSMLDFFTSVLGVAATSSYIITIVVVNRTNFIELSKVTFFCNKNFSILFYNT